MLNLNLICSVLLISLFKQTKSECNNVEVDYFNKRNLCFNNSTEDTLCCIGLNTGTLKAWCGSWPRINYTGFTSSYVKEQTVFFDCGPQAIKNLPSIRADQQQCGPYSPVSSSHCWEYSRDDNSCCFYDTLGQRGCLWAGYKFIGSTRLGSNTTIQCKSYFVTLNIFLIGFYVLIIIFEI